VCEIRGHGNDKVMTLKGLVENDRRGGDGYNYLKPPLSMPPYLVEVNTSNRPEPVMKVC
jgi:hypothetical protein